MMRKLILSVIGAFWSSQSSMVRIRAFYRIHVSSVSCCLLTTPGDCHCIAVGHYVLVRPVVVPPLQGKSVELASDDMLGSTFALVFRRSLQHLHLRLFCVVTMCFW